ncbi:MAG: Nitrilotriacetate monooxygenase component B, partial [uncultured Actinomycetospora sp.]
AHRLRPRHRRRRRLLQAADLGDRPATDRLGGDALGRRRRQPRAALVLHRRVHRPADRAVHVDRGEGLAAQRRGHRRVHGVPDARAAARARQRHGHRLPAGRERDRRDRADPRAVPARRHPARRRVAGGAGVPARAGRAPGQLRGRPGPGAPRGDRRDRPRRRAPRRAPPRAAGPPRGQRVVDAGRGARDPAHPLRRLARSLLRGVRLRVLEHL